MIDFEMKFIAKRNQLILKYGEAILKTPGLKSAALIIMQRKFESFPKSLSLEEQIAYLEEMSSLPEIRIELGQLNKTQENFLYNRFCEIILESKDSKSINKENYSFEDKLYYVKHIGDEILYMMADFIPNLNVNDNFKYYASEIYRDFYYLYILEYGLYNQNDKHPIFLNANGYKNSYTSIKNVLPKLQVGAKKSGCFGIIMIIFAIVLIYLVC